MAEQLALLDLGPKPTPTPTPTPARTWADLRTGDRITYTMPRSEWHGTWTVRRIGPHPHCRPLLIVDLVDGTGRTWETWANRDVACPGAGAHWQTRPDQ